MITFKSHLTEMSLRRPDGLSSVLGNIHYTDFRHGDDSMTLESLTDFAVKHGWKKLGNGFHGIVYGHDKYPWCIKIFSDGTYMNWVKYCQSRNNSYLPVFRGKPINFRHVSIVRIEKLRPISGNDHVKLLKRLSQEPTRDAEIVEIRDLFRSIIKTNMFMGHKTFLDIHTANIMVRSNGEEVFTDPIAGQTTTERYNDYYGRY